jgi:hypothetical protein
MQKLCTLCDQDDSCESCRNIRNYTNLDDIMQKLLSIHYEPDDPTLITDEDFIITYKTFILLLFHSTSFPDFEKHEYFDHIFNKIIFIVIHASLDLHNSTWIYMYYYDLFACNPKKFGHNHFIRTILCGEVMKNLLTKSNNIEESTLLCDIFTGFFKYWIAHGYVIDTSCVCALFLYNIIHNNHENNNVYCNYIIDHFDDFYDLLSSKEQTMSFLRKSKKGTLYYTLYNLIHNRYSNDILREFDFETTSITSQKKKQKKKQKKVIKSQKQTVNNNTTLEDEDVEITVCMYLLDVYKIY